MRTLLIIHVIGAAVGLVAGATALASAKGARLHRRSGKIFVAAMLTMSTSAIVLAVFRTQPLNVVAGLLTAYLVATALTTVRPRSAAMRRLDIGLMLGALVAGVVAIGLATGGEPGSRIPFLMFGLAGVLGSIGDLKMLRAGRLTRVPKIARHLWRMCLALWIATASFFLGPRARVEAVLPDVLVRTPLLIIPVLAVLAVMFYSLWRTKRGPRAQPAAV